MADRGAPPFPTSATPPLVGRERELAALREHLASAMAGHGSLVLIGGEAGIGKSSLAGVVVAEAMGQGALALVGRCYDLSETPPYGPWHDLFAHAPFAACPVPPPLGPLADGERARPTGQAALLGRMRDFLVAATSRQPLVLVLDDLHWADPASLELLRLLARDLAPLPALLVAIYRTEELTRHHPLFPLLPVLIREAAARHLDLRALDDDAIRAWLRARYRLADPHAARLVAYLRARAEGNPFFAGELLRALEETGLLRAAGGAWALGDLAGAVIPALLRQVLAGRVGRLGEGARALLTTAAVIGQEVPLALWAAAAETDEDGLLDTIERAVDARLLEETPDGATVRFAHALIREALYEGTLVLRRRRMHRRVAEVLAKAVDPDPDAVAYHFRRAGDPRAAEWLVRAGDRAQRAYAWLTAAERFEAALALLERDEAADDERGWLLLRLAMLQRYADIPRALAYLDRVPPCADRRLTAHATFHRGLLLCYTGDFSQGQMLLAAGAAALDACPPPDARQDARVASLIPLGIHQTPARRRDTLAIWAAGLGDLCRACAVWGVGSGRESEAPIAPERLPVESDGGWAGFAYAALGRPAEARAGFARYVATLRARQDHRQTGFVLLVELHYVLLTYQADALGERARLAAEIDAALVRTAGVASRDELIQLGRLPLLLLEGRWSEAHQESMLPQSRGPAAIMAVSLGALAHHRGDAALAWRRVRAVLPAGAAAEPGVAWFMPAQQAQRLAAARAWLAAHDRWLAWSGAILGQAEGQLGWADYHRAAGDPTLARQHAATALAHATEPRQPLALLAAHRLLGELDTNEGHHVDAAAHLGEALALADACAAPYECALILLALAELRAATGDEAGARSPVEEACVICASLGAAPALARAASLAARLDTAPARSAPYPAGLTAREVEVLRLVAAGQSNRAIASTLFLSPHTVERHVANLYAKTDTHSRAEATAFARHHRLA